MLQRLTAKLVVLCTLGGMLSPLAQAALPPASPHCVRPAAPAAAPLQGCHDMAGMGVAAATREPGSTEIRAGADCCPNHDCCRSMGCSERAFVAPSAAGHVEPQPKAVAPGLRCSPLVTTLPGRRSGRAPPLS